MSPTFIYVYSEYDYIVRAYQFVAHMFSAGSGYIGLIAAIGVAAIMFGGIVFLSNQAVMGRGSIYAWLLSVLIASVVITSITTMKSDVTIHDLTTNRWTTVGGVPTVMATLAGLENAVEINTVDVIKTVMSPIIPYEMIGKGQGFDLLASFNDVGSNFFSRQPYTLESMSNYWNSCVLPDITYGWINQNKLFSTDDMWAAIKSDTNSRTATVVTIDTNGKRKAEPQTCATAYNSITAQLNVASLRQSLQEKCETYPIGDVTKCENNTEQFIQTLIAPTSDKNKFIRSFLTAWVINSEGGVLQSMLVDMNKKNASQAFMAEKTLPRLKGMMYGMMIGLFPFLVAFIWISPARTITYYAGMFIMMILWSAIDTFMDMQYQHEVYNMFAMMRKQGLGLQQMFDIPNIAADAVSLYGQGRWMSLGLATAISGAITKANSYALAQMGSQLGATAQGAAAAGAGYMDSAGQTRLAEQTGKDQAARNVSTYEPVANYSQGIANAETQQMLSKAYAGKALSESLGNKDAAEATAGKQAGALIGENALAQSAGMNMQEFNTWKNSGGYVTPDIADTLVQSGAISRSTANQMIGLQADVGAMTVGADGKVANIKASGVKDDKAWQVTEAASEARYQAKETGMHANVEGLIIGNGASVTEKYDRDGQINQIGIEGGGFSRFSAQVENGQMVDATAKGMQTLYNENGKEIGTIMHDGVNKTYSGTNEDGSAYKNTFVYDQDSGGLRQTSGELITADGVKINQTFDQNGKISQETFTGDGYENFSKQFDQNGNVTMYGTRTYKDAGGNVITDKHEGTDMSRSYRAKDNSYKEQYTLEKGSFRINSSEISIGKNGEDLGGRLTATTGAIITKSMDGSKTVTGVVTYGDREFDGKAVFNKDGELVNFTATRGQSMTQQDIDNINKERLNTYSEGQLIDMRGSKFKFDGNAIAQSFASGQDDGSLNTVADYYNDMKDWKNYAENIARNGDRTGEHKEQYDNAMDNYKTFKNNYEKSLVAYTSAAADGVSAFVNINKSSSHSSSTGNTTTYQDIEQAKLEASVGIGSGSGVLPASIGGSYSSVKQKNDSLNQSMETSSSLQINKNELGSRIRNEIVSGLQNGLSVDSIIKNINDNTLSK